jgi:DNA-binding response OmpR family regulator
MRQHRKQICVIDSDDSAAHMIEEALRPLPAQISRFSCAEDALRAFETQRFALIILDLILPAMSGFELLDRINGPKGATPPPVIVASLLVLDDLVGVDTPLQADVAVPKPIEAAILHRHVARILSLPLPEPTPETGTQVLLVEDDEYNAELVRLRLEHGAFHVTRAADGESALRRFHEQRPALVLLDIQIPEPNGLEVMRAIRAVDPDVLIIIMTAFGSEKIAVEAMKIGADEYLTKPLEHRTLVQFIQKALTRNLIKIENRKLSERLRLSNRTLLHQYRATAAAKRALEEQQDELIRAQRLAAVTEAAVSINHEINNPLCSIMGNADLLLRKHPGADADIIRKVRSIERESARIREITKKLANLANVVTTRYAGGVDMIDIDRSVDPGATESG